MANVVLGNVQIKPWYPSFYPEEIVGRKVERLYVCQSCFRYSKELMPYLGHVVWHSIALRACVTVVLRQVASVFSQG